MKRFISILTVSAMILTTVIAILTLAGCTRKESELKLGLGVYTAASASDATEDKAGQGQVTVTAAAVLIDTDGKIVKAFVDCADNKVGYTADGKAVANNSFKTKYESGTDYNMVAYGGAKKEWFEQADAFCALVAGKTAEEVKALVAEGGKGTDEVLKAGCTIDISDFAKAVERAVANAETVGATKDDTIKLEATTSQTTNDAAEGKAGENKVETTFVAKVVNAEGKAVASSSESVKVNFSFDTAGKSDFDATRDVLSEKGN